MTSPPGARRGRGSSPRRSSGPGGRRRSRSRMWWRASRRAPPPRCRLVRACGPPGARRVRYNIELTSAMPGKLIMVATPTRSVPDGSEPCDWRCTLWTRTPGRCSDNRHHRSWLAYQSTGFSWRGDDGSDIGRHVGLVGR
jgi:hypothetical protein